MHELKVGSPNHTIDSRGDVSACRSPAPCLQNAVHTFIPASLCDNGMHRNSVGTGTKFGHVQSALEHAPRYARPMFRKACKGYVS